MADILHAVQHYGPKLELNPTVRSDQLSSWLAMRTGLNKSEFQMMLQELNEAILFFNSQGMPLKLPGIGTFTPSIDRTGKLKVNLRVDTELKNGLNVPDAYAGRILNKKRIGLPDAGYKALWDAEHPDDPLEI